MIRLGLRLTMRGGREGAVRLVMIVAAVGLGAGLLLTTLAGFNAVNAQNARYAWLETDAPGARAVAAPPRGGTAATPDPLWWKLTGDLFHGKVIGRVDVAATGPHSPVPPGLGRLPGPGEFYASPAMARLLRATPADQLGDRYPGRQVGTVGPAALPAPNSLIIVVGRPMADLARVQGATRVTAISTTVPSSCSGDCYFIGIDANGIDLILSVVVAALLFPVFIFIGVATRLSAARREQRFAAMRLAGATPRQTATISAVEATAAAMIGVAFGFGLFYLARPALAPIPFTGAPFFLGDLSPNLADVLAVAAGVPAAAAVAAWFGVRRVNASPLGVSRRVTPVAPSAWRLVPLVAGLGELAVFVVVGRPAATTGQVTAYLPGILVSMSGIVLAGPWLTMAGSRLVTRRANGPAALIAGRRLSDDPRAGFRAVSGLILALFVSTVATGVITTMSGSDGSWTDNELDRSTLLAQFTDYATTPPSTSVRSVPDAVRAALRSIPGVEAATPVYANPDPAGGAALGAPPGYPAGVVSCAQLARTPALGRCPAGAVTATIWPDLGPRGGPDLTLPPATVPAGRLSALAVYSLAVATDGSHAAIERARTVLRLAFPAVQDVSTFAEQNDRQDTLNTQFQQLANVVILASLAIAGCTLAVSVVAGLNERKRPFGLLRVTGTPLATLRRVVALETVVPLLILAAVSIGTGFLTAYLFLRSQLSETLRSPDVGYYVAVVAGLVVSLAIIASTLPVLERITGPESARFE